MDVVVVIPAYNERAYIEQTVLDWLRVLDKLDGRLIAVDDGSKDSTGVILDRLAEKEPRLLVHHQQNAGHGAAILAGYRMAIALNPDYHLPGRQRRSDQAKRILASVGTARAIAVRPRGPSGQKRRGASPSSDEHPERAQSANLRNIHS